MSRKNRRIWEGGTLDFAAPALRLLPCPPLLLQGGEHTPDVDVFRDERNPPVDLHLFADPKAPEQLLESLDGGHRVLLRDHDGDPQRLGMVPGIAPISR